MFWITAKYVIVIITSQPFIMIVCQNCLSFNCCICLPYLAWNSTLMLLFASLLLEMPSFHTKSLQSCLFTTIPFASLPPDPLQNNNLQSPSREVAYISGCNHMEVELWSSGVLPLCLRIAHASWMAVGHSTWSPTVCYVRAPLTLSHTKFFTLEEVPPFWE